MPLPKKPKVIAEVMKAILHLKDNRGSSLKKIVDVVEDKLSIKDVKKGLKFGIDNGLIKCSGGNFRLGLDLGQMVRRSAEDGDSITNKIYMARRRRRGGRRRRGRSGRRRRRHANELSDTECCETDYTEGSEGTPVREHRRRGGRRRRGGSRRRRGHRRRRRSAGPSESGASTEEDNGTGMSSGAPENDRKCSGCNRTECVCSSIKK
ncbi:unnamed protein product [Callosobruchus maculatus]|uniref:H15 domain-containing protein n=1 Tax=Callosobruchus maculatus TaxID=64391 RepID=A0A653DCB2_CALMS|nr:unnamed protein product [Callosobruchus maculatus]